MELFNYDYEKCLLAALIQDNTVGEIAIGQIQQEWFYDPTNVKLYKEICKELSEKKFCSIQSLATALPSLTSYILEVSGATFSSSNWEFYAGELKRLYTTRSLKVFLKDSESNLNPQTVDDIVGNLDSFINDCLSSGGEETFDIKNLVGKFLAEVEENSKKDGRWLGVSTGWDNLSDIIDGIEYGKLMIIGARPSIGKSAFALQLASNLCKEKTPCAYFSLEMSAVSLMTRLVAVESGLPIYHIKHASQSNRQFYDKLNIALSKIYEFDLSIDDRRLRNEKELYSKIRYLAKTNGTKVFFVDHIGLVPYSNPMMKRVEQLDDITRSLLSLAQELGVTIICLCQLKRDSEGKRPTLADLRDSGAIEQNSDICLFLHRERATGSEIEIPTEVMVIKNRDGACGTADMLFIPQQTKFKEVKKESYCEN